MRPKRPTVGKAKPGITFSGLRLVELTPRRAYASERTNDGGDSEPTNRVTVPSESECRGVRFERPLQGSIVMRQKECRLSGCTYADR